MTESSAINLLVVCGATASGKTRLGVEMARRYDGEIISVDSRQVYRGLDIGSGKDLDEYETPDGAVPYHLIDIVDPQQVYSLWNYLEDFDRAFADITSRDRLPVAVGGTGLYLEGCESIPARRWLIRYCSTRSTWEQAPGWSVPYSTSGSPSRPDFVWTVTSNCPPMSPYHLGESWCSPRNRRSPATRPWRMHSGWLSAPAAGTACTRCRHPPVETR
jgi:hypothetical protein